MNASLKKRIGAYAIDVILIVLLTSIVCLFIPTTQNAITLNEQLIELQNSYIDQDISFNQYFNGSADIIKDLDQEQILYYVVMATLMLGYFVIWPFYHNGQTYGKRKLNIKVVNTDDKQASINQLLIRNLIINGLGYLLIQLLIVFVLPSTSYYITLSSLSIIQLIIIIVSITLIIKKPNKLGLHDLIAKTKVIEVEK